MVHARIRLCCQKSVFTQRCCSTALLFVFFLQQLDKMTNVSAIALAFVIIAVFGLIQTSFFFFFFLVSGYLSVHALPVIMRVDCSYSRIQTKLIVISYAQ